MQKRQIYWGIVAAALIFVMVMFAMKSWRHYQSLNALQQIYTKLQYTKPIEELRFTLLYELTCRLGFTSHNHQKKPCTKIHHLANSRVQEVLEYLDENDIKGVKEYSDLMQNVHSFRGDNWVILQLQKELNSQVSSVFVKHLEVLQNLDRYGIDMQKLKAYKILYTITLATVLENAFVVYMSSLHQPIKKEWYLLWEKLTKHSEIQRLKELIETENIDDLKRFVHQVLQIDRQIDSMRIKMFYGATQGDFELDVIAWVDALQKRLAILHQMRNVILSSLYRALQERIGNERILVVANVMAIVAFLVAQMVWFLLFRHSKRTDLSLQKVENAIFAMQQNNSSSFKTLHDALGDLVKQMHHIQQQHDHLSTQYHRLLFFVTQQSEALQRYSYALQGYCMLFQSRNLDAEQQEFLQMWRIYARGVHEVAQRCSEHKKEPIGMLQQVFATKPFPLLRHFEAIAARFSDVCIRKEIYYAVYIDPQLDQEYIGSVALLTEALEALLGSVLQKTPSYGSIDLKIEQLERRGRITDIAFIVEYQGEPFHANEMEHITSKKIDTICNNEDAIRSLWYAQKVLDHLKAKLHFKELDVDRTRISFVVALSSHGDQSDQSMSFKGLRVGIALPDGSVARTQEKTIQAYLGYMGIECSIYTYASLFRDDDTSFALPDIMMFYHRYSKLEGELDRFASLECKTVLLTTSLLRPLILGSPCIDHIMYEPILYSRLVHMLMLLLSHETSDAQVAQPAFVAQAQFAEFQDMQVLLVESNRITRKFLQEMLEGFGVKVVAVSSAKEALEAKQSGQFDIVFISMSLSDLDGFKVANKMIYHEKTSGMAHVPIVLLTSDKDQDQHVLKLGIDGLLSKTPTKWEVEGILRRFGFDHMIEHFAKLSDNTGES